MNWKYVVGGVVVVLTLGLILGTAFYTGVGPAPGDADAGDAITDFPTATPADGGSGGGEAASSSTSNSPPFSFTVDSVEECGQTCRDVTATLHNNQQETASGVTVFVRIFAGRNNNDTDDLVWEQREEVGTLEANESHTTTQRVELSLREALHIDRNDGWVTIVTTVRSDDRMVTFRGNEQVS